MRHKRLKLSTLLLLGLGLTGLQAQEAIPAAGGNASGSGGTVSYCLGQVAYQTHTGTSGSVAGGVQQPYEISVVTGMEEIQGINLSVSAYPNPTIDYLTLSISSNSKTSYDLSQYSYQLFDIQGKLLQTEKITSNQVSIDMSNLVPTSYFIKVSQNNNVGKTFQVIKN